MPTSTPRPRSLVGRPVALAAATAALLVVAEARADLFGVTVDAPGLDPVTVTGESLFDLAESVIESQDQFLQFEGTSFTGTLDYAGLDDAIIVSGDAGNPDSVRVQIPSIGFDRTFATEDEAEDFLQEDGADVVADFIRVVNEETLVGVTDGNPAALTAVLADDAFRNFAEFRNPFVGYSQGGDAVRFYGSAATISTDVGDGTLYQGALTFGAKFTDNVGLSLSVPGAYREIEGSQTFFGGLQLGLPINFASPGDDGGLLWQTTPYGLAAAGGSQDQLSGGIILGGGVVNLVGVRLGDFTISSGQQAVFYGGTPIEYDDFRFETEVDQTLVRASLQATYGGIGQNAFLTGGVAYTTYLDDAGVEDWISPMAGVGLKFGGGNVLRLGYRGDLGDGFDMHAGEVELRFAF